MSLDHAILGFLQYGPLSGYDLKERFDLSVEHFWPADQSQIYRILAKLDEQGYARVKVVEQENRPDRKVYTITQAGREELHRWLTTPLAVDQGRGGRGAESRPSCRSSSPDSSPTKRFSASFAARRSNAAREWTSCGKSRPRPIEPPRRWKNPREAWCWFLTLECGTRVTEAKLAWMEDVIAGIEKGEIPRMKKRPSGRKGPH